MLLRTHGTTARVLVDPVTGLPRFWACVWASGLEKQGLKETTLNGQLHHIGGLYEQCDERYGRGSLDRAIGAADISSIRMMVSDFYLSLSTETSAGSARVRWNVVQGFIRDLGKQLGGHDPSWLALVEYTDLFGQIRQHSKGKVRGVRALPDASLRDLLKVAHPDSDRNPFVLEQVRTRNWLIVHLLLLCGLRRGELLLLVVDSLKRDIDPATGEVSYWLDVTNAEEEDERAYRPSIKTLDSHRQIPISAELASLYEHYVGEVRVAASSAFLFTSERGLPLSVESVTKMFEVLTSALTDEALEKFRIQSKGKRHISPHDLRHTCATARYSMFMESGANRELTLQRMRAFFGWSVTSKMPELYAHSAIKDDLLRAWNDAFDRRIEGLRGLSR